MRIVVYVLLGIAAVTTILSLIGPNIDLAHRRPVLRPGHRQFRRNQQPVSGAAARARARSSVYTCIGVIVLALASFLPWRLPSIAPRKAIALTLSLVLGPGILVNGILKPYGGRPRPIEVTEFGGPLQFVDWWNPTGACEGNCSFMSGEATDGGLDVRPCHAGAAALAGLGARRGVCVHRGRSARCG